MKVLVHSEKRDLLLEGIGVARELGGEVICLSWEEDVLKYCDRLYYPKGDYSESKAVSALEEIAKGEEVDLLVIGGTKRGKEVAARVSQRLEVGSITDAISVSKDGGDRMGYGGRVLERLKFKRKPGVFVIPPGKFEKVKKESGDGELIEISPKSDEKIKVIEKKEKERGKVNVEEADIIVSVGRGFKKKEDISMAEELAKKLGGVIGCSRPVAADLRWLPEEHWIGLSGRKVRPKLYIALGISGQIQHIAGIMDSKIIVAINKDEEAPIFKNCDYGIVGDIYEVIPLMIKNL